MCPDRLGAGVRTVALISAAHVPLCRTHRRGPGPSRLRRRQQVRRPEPVRLQLIDRPAPLDMAPRIRLGIGQAPPARVTSAVLTRGARTSRLFSSSSAPRSPPSATTHAARPAGRHPARARSRTSPSAPTPALESDARSGRSGARTRWWITRPGDGGREGGRHWILVLRHTAPARWSDMDVPTAQAGASASAVAGRSMAIDVINPASDVPEVGPAAIPDVPLQLMACNGPSLVAMQLSPPRARPAQPVSTRVGTADHIYEA